MTWWYENEVEEMKLYKNEDLCIECKNEFFSKPYDHRDPTPGQLGYCIKCDNCLIKEKKMEFDKSRVYTALNAEELKAGDKVIVSMSLNKLREKIECANYPITTLTEVLSDDFTFRFRAGTSSFPLAYLVERHENCTNCGSTCGYEGIAFRKDKTCNNWQPKAEPKTKQKAEKAPAWFVKGLMNGNIERTSDEAEPHYRPFKDTDELIKVWAAKIGTPNWGTDGDLSMPLIWVRNNFTEGASLITHFWKAKDVGYKEGEESDYVTIDGEEVPVDDMLTYYSHDRDKDDGCPVGFTFLDGSPCGVEE